MLWLLYATHLCPIHYLMLCPLLLHYFWKCVHNTGHCRSITVEKLGMYIVVRGDKLQWGIWVTIGLESVAPEGDWTCDIVQTDGFPEKKQWGSFHGKHEEQDCIRSLFFLPTVEQRLRNVTMEYRRGGLAEWFHFRRIWSTAILPKLEWRAPRSIKSQKAT